MKTPLSILLSATLLLNASAQSKLDDPNIGIKYDKKQGLRVTPASAKILGFKLVDVEERQLTGTVELQVQLYQAASDKVKAQGSAWLGQDDAAKLSAGQKIKLERGFDGAISRIGSAQPNRLVEVIIEIDDPDQKLKAGKFLSAAAEISTDGEVPVIPKASVLTTTEGIFAYVDNAGWTVRTEVELGVEQDGSVEIVDGIYAGDLVVSAPTMTLWMVELQLTKSGKT